MTIITRLDVFLCLFYRMKKLDGGSYTKNEITLRILEGMALNYPSCCIFSMASKYRRQKWDRKGDCLERKIIKMGAQRKLWLKAVTLLPRFLKTFSQDYYHGG